MVDYSGYGQGQRGVFGFKERRINADILRQQVEELGQRPEAQTDDELQAALALAGNANRRFTQRAAIEHLASVNGSLKAKDTQQSQWDSYLDGVGADWMKEFVTAKKFADTDLDLQQIDQESAQAAQAIKLAKQLGPAEGGQFLRTLATTGRFGNVAALEDIETRLETLFDNQVEDLDEQGRVLRNTRMVQIEAHDLVDTNLGQLGKLLSDPEFDPRSPLGRGQVITLLGGTARQMLQDPTGFDDVLKGVGGAAVTGGAFATAANPLVGGAIAAGGLAASTLGAMLDSGDFDWTREEIAIIARAAEEYNKQARIRTIDSTARAAQGLDEAAAKLNYSPALSYYDSVMVDNPERTQRIAEHYDDDVSQEDAQTREVRREVERVLGPGSAQTENAITRYLKSQPKGSTFNPDGTVMQPDGTVVNPPPSARAKLDQIRRQRRNRENYNR